jgi:predicted AlkP superfamily pyrophosphatase or phosphodiesterase
MNFMQSIRSGVFALVQAVGLLIAIAFINSAGQPVSAQSAVQKARVPKPRMGEQPRLVVFIAIDQMRGDYIDRYRGQWSGGLKRLVNDGARFPEAAYPYFTTVTCAGHATMGSGTFPNTHGQIANSWFDRESHKETQCTDDASVTQISYGTQDPARVGGNSAARMLAPSFADELRAQGSRTPRIVSLSMKPRSAIGLAGHAGDVVLWYDTGKGWATSTAFAKEKNPLVEKFIESNPMTRELATPWTKLLPESAYLYEDDGLKENPPAGWTNTFPHALLAPGAQPDDAAYDRWENSPFADDYLARMAIALVDGFKMGQTPGTDFLAISFSTLDRVGHPFGPRSHEVQDTLARLDRTLGTFLDALNTRIGYGNYVVALTGDHGVSPIPEQMAAMHFDAGRIETAKLSAKINETLTQRLTGGSNEMVEKVTGSWVYLAPGVYDKLKARPDAMQALSDAIVSVPGIARIITRDQLESDVATDDPLVRAARLSYFRGRSGDLLIVSKPYWLSGAGGTSHGTPYRYDQRVPVLFYGAGVKPGTYWGAASPADIAPTLAAICGITMSRPDGHALGDALASPTSSY